MKKIFCLIIAVLLMFVLLACKKDDTNDTKNGNADDEMDESEINLQEYYDELPFSEPTEFRFSSGSEMWYTTLTVRYDGTFTGEYYASDLGELSDEFPNGRVYTCIFEGKFEKIIREDEYVYAMSLGEVKTEKTPGEEWIENGTKYVVSTPYGLTEGKEFKLFCPETRIDTVPEEFLSWWPRRHEQLTDPIDTLDCYGILNVNTEDGFFSVD